MDIVDNMDSVDNMDFVDRVDIVDRIVKRSTLSMLSILVHNVDPHHCLDYSSGSSSITIVVPRVDGRQLITCARSIFVCSVPAVCHNFTQKVRVSP